MKILEISPTFEKKYTMPKDLWDEVRHEWGRLIFSYQDKGRGLISAIEKLPRDKRKKIVIEKFRDVEKVKEMGRIDDVVILDNEKVESSYEN